MPFGAGFWSVVPPGTDHSHDLALEQFRSSEDVTFIQAPHTPKDGTIGHVQLPVGQFAGRVVMFVESMPLYIAARVATSGSVPYNQALSIRCKMLVHPLTSQICARAPLVVVCAPWHLTGHQVLIGPGPCALCSNDKILS